MERQSAFVPASIAERMQKWQNAKIVFSSRLLFLNRWLFCRFGAAVEWDKHMSVAAQNNAKTSGDKRSEQAPPEPKKVIISLPEAKPEPIIAPTIVIEIEKSFLIAFMLNVYAFGGTV